MITPMFQFLLGMHVIFGVIAAATAYMVLLNLLKKDLPLKVLRGVSLASFISVLISWVSGGYYYVMYYGDKVKPIIIKGAYPWAHTIFTESKEHVFLFLPFATLTLTVMLWRMGDQMGTNELLRKATVFLAATVTGIAIFITLAGIAISGGVR